MGQNKYSVQGLGVLMLQGWAAREIDDLAKQEKYTIEETFQLKQEA